MANPTPTPRRILPMISMAMFTAAAFRMTPTKKNIDAACIVSFRPCFVQIFEATKLATKAARYNDEVKS